MFRLSCQVIVIALLANLPSASAQSLNQAQADCFRSKLAIEKIAACGYAIPRTSDFKILERLFLRRGNALVELDRNAEAISDFSELLRLAPRVAGYYDNRQAAYRSLGMYNEALADANTAIQVAPNHSFVYRSRALTYEAMKQFVSAITDFDTAASMNSQDIGLIVDRARIKSKAGRVREAINELSHVLEIDRNNSPAYKERGMAYLADGNLFAAKQDLTIASLNMPSDPDIPRALSAIASQLQAAPIPSPPQPSPSQSKMKASSGSAFRIANGKFVTNHHVINGCNWLTVDGKLGGRLLASDQTRDLALVSVANDSGPIASIRTSRIQLNESITAAGFPLEGAFSGIAITNGTISRLSGLGGDTGEVQISAPVQPGNSGGPLLDTAGNVIGVVSSKLNALKMAGVSGDIPQNVNFAINGSSLRAFLDAKNVNYKEISNERELTGVQIAARASAFTVLIECQR